MSDKLLDQDMHVLSSKGLDEAILHFALGYSSCGSVEQLKNEMVDAGFSPVLIHEVVTISTIAFGRALFDGLGIKYPKVVIRAREDGSVEPNVEVTSIPAYTRALALIDTIQASLSRQAFRLLCLYNAESRAIVKAVKAVGQGLDFKEICLYPVVIPDLHVKQDTVKKAFEVIDRLKRIHWPTGVSCRRTWRSSTFSEEHV